MISEDLEFLSELDNELHGFRDFPSGPGENIQFDIYNLDRKISPKELERILNISGQENYIFLPTKIDLGLNGGYALRDLKNEKDLLKFSEEQLPERYNFEKLSEWFMNEENQGKARIFGIKIINNREVYKIKK